MKEIGAGVYIVGKAAIRPPQGNDMKRIHRLIASTALLLALTACHAPGDGQPKQASAPMELKIYAVPAQQTDRLASALGLAMGGKATVTAPVPGKLLVYASHDAQASIATAIASLAQSSASNSPAPQVDLHFWVVDGESGAGKDDPALKSLSAALDKVRQSMGPMHFQLDQVVAARSSLDGRDTSIVAATDDGYPRAFDFLIKGVQGDLLDLWLGYEDHGERGLAKFKSQITLRSGQYVVLAQGPGACAPALPGKVAPPCSVKPALRLLIVRADMPPPQA